MANDLNEVLAGAVGGFAQGVGQSRQTRRDLEAEVLKDRYKQQMEQKMLQEQLGAIGGKGFARLRPKSASIGGVSYNIPQTDEQYEQEVQRAVQKKTRLQEVEDRTGVYKDVDPQKLLGISRSLKKDLGARGMKTLLPVAVDLMRKKPNLTVDEIGDQMRYASQSEQFRKYRPVVQNLVMGASSGKSRDQMDFLDDAISSGNETRIQNAFKRTARANSDVDTRKQLQGKERTIKFMDEIENDLRKYEAAGGRTGIFTGTREQVAGKIGKVVDPELRKIATKIHAVQMGYRRSMSGAAFSVPESKEYKSVFPDENKTLALNTAIISGLREAMQGDIDNFYALSMGEQGYSDIFKQAPQQRGFKQPGGGNNGTQGLGNGDLSDEALEREYNLKYGGQ